MSWRDFQGRMNSAGQTSSRNRFLLAEGREHSRQYLHRRAARSPPLEGLCGPEAGYGVGLFVKSRKATGKPSRFSSETGTKADAKQQPGASLCFVGSNAFQNQNGPKGACAAVERKITGF